MSDLFFRILAKKIDLYLNPNMADLGFKTSDLIRSLKPEDINRVSSLVEGFTPIVGETINKQFLEITSIIKTALNDAKITVSEELKKNIVAICEEKINVEIYLSRFPKLIDAIERNYSGMGINFDRNRYRLDISSSKYEVMVRNLVRRNISKIESELEILSLATDVNQTNSSLNSGSEMITHSALQKDKIWDKIASDFEVSKRAFGKNINFVADSFKRKIFFRDIGHAYELANHGFSKPAVILAGGVIEELLRLYLTSKGIKLQKKTFDSYIQACEKNGLLKVGISRLSDSVRHFRNIVHLEKEKTSKITITKATAKGAVTSIFTIANDF